MKHLPIIIALIAALAAALLAGAPPAGAQADWRERGLFNRPQPREAGKPPLPPPPPPAQAPALSPELAQEFDQAHKMSVAEYLQRYGGGPGGHEYQVGPLDTLSVQIYDEPELSREELRVAADGGIALPLIGRIKVEGLTTAQIEDEIERQFRQGGFLLEPHASVAIKEFKSRRVMIMGAVNLPGTHIMEGNEHLLEMLSKAGGVKFDPQGDVAANSIRVLRTVDMPGGGARRVSMDINLESLTRGLAPEENLLMQEGDVVYVPEAPRFFVTGEVKNPGYYKIKDRDVSVVEAITMAGGPTRAASLGRTRVVRAEGGREVTLDVPVDDILDGDKSKDVTVRPGDVIVVPQSFF